ncbi:MAG: carboxymuconolactone decarboxylase family protein [Myxococcales bacterium]
MVLNNTATPSTVSVPEMSQVEPGSSLRLAPIDRPKSLLVRLFNWFVRRTFGKAMMPARVIYARLPTLLWRSLPFYHLMDRGLSLEKELCNLIEVHVAGVNGCSFCHDMHLAQAMRTKTNREKLKALGGSIADSKVLNARERAALVYVEEIAHAGVATDATFAALKACFTDREIVEITWLQAFATYLLRMAKPLGIDSDGYCALMNEG